MPINASIPLGIQPMQLQFQKPESKVNMLAQVLQLQQAESGNKLNSLKLQQAERDLATETAIGEAWREATGADGALDRNRLTSTLATKGYGAKIPGIQKQFLDADKAKFDVQKAAFDSYKNFQTTLASQFSNPNLSRQSVLAAVTPLVESGSFDRATALRLLQTLPEDPQQLREHLRGVLTSQMTPEQMLTVFAPKPEKMDNGQQISFRDTNPNSPTYGQVTGGAPVQKVATPEAVLSAETQRRGQNMTDQRARDQNAILQQQRDAARTEVKESADGFVMVDKGTGKVTVLNGPDGKPLSRKLKDAPPAVQAAVLTNAQNLSRAERALALVEGKDIGDPAKGGQKGDKEATGLKGYLPNQILNRVDPDGVDARAAIADLGSLIIHDRSGAAVTAAEFPRLAPFIPTEKDDATTVKKKLRRFVQVYREEMANIQGTYNPDNGYRTPGGGATPAAGQVLKFDAQGNPVN